jgi:hypothetical protein
MSGGGGLDVVESSRSDLDLVEKVGHQSVVGIEPIDDGAQLRALGRTAGKSEASSAPWWAWTSSRSS